MAKEKDDAVKETVGAQENVEVATQETKEVAVPETKFVSGPNGQAAGLEDIDKQTDIKIPRILILQALSELVKDKKGDGGQIANSITGEILGDSFEFIPLHHFKTRVKFVLGKGAVCMSRSALTSSFGDTENSGYVEGTNCIECPDSAWQGKEAPKCSLVYNFLVLDAKNLSAFPIVISCAKSAIKEAKTLISMAAFTGEDLCARIYKLTTKEEKSPKGEFFMPQFELLRRVSVEEYKTSCGIRDAMREKVIEVDLESGFDTSEHAEEDDTVVDETK